MRSLRNFFCLTAAATLLTAAVWAQAPAPAQQRGGGNRLTPGGSGPIRVLLITKGHAFDRAPFFEMFDQLGETITWTHVEQPSAQLYFDTKNSKDFDVFVFYDAMGRDQKTKPDGSTYFEDAKPEAKEGLKQLLRQGKGMVFFHHSIAAWNQAWPEYSEIIGGVCDWRNPVTARGKKFPNSGAQAGEKQHITVLDTKHPITEGLGTGFDITDEAYLCPYYEDSIKPLLRTSFVPLDKNFPRRYEGGWRHPEGSNLTGWYKTAERSPIVYIQHGHDRLAWENPMFQKLMTNAIKWAASKQAMDWAAANPTKIFK